MKGRQAHTGSPQLPAAQSGPTQLATAVPNTMQTTHMLLASPESRVAFIRQALAAAAKLAVVWLHREEVEQVS